MARSVQPEGTDGRRLIFMLSLANFLIFMGAGAQQQYLVAYLGDISRWSGVQRAAVQAAVYAAMMVCRIANVWLLRRWTDRRHAIIGSLTYTGFCLAMVALFFGQRHALALYEHLGPRWGEGLLYASALLCAVVWGWGAAAFWAGTSLLTMAATDAGRRRYGSAFGVLLSSTHAGFFLGVLLLGRIYQALPERGVFLLYVAAAVITVPGTVVLVLSPNIGHRTPELPSLARVVQIATSRKALIAGFLLLCSALTFGLMLGAFGDFIKGEYGKGYIWILASLYPLARLVFSLVGGLLSDRLGRAAVLGAGFVLAAAGTLLCAMWRQPVAVGVGVFALGIMSGIVPVVGTALVGDSAERARRPLVYGHLFAARDLGVFLAALFSRVIEASLGDFTRVFYIFALAFAACGVAAIPLAHRPQEGI